MNTKLTSWLDVTTSSGMFSSEYAVALKLADGSEVSLFADKTQIREKAGKAMLKVTLVESGVAGGPEKVLLPTETFETASRWVQVPKGSVHHDTEQR